MDYANARNDYSRAGTLGGAVGHDVPQTEAVVPPVFHAIDKLERNANGLLDALGRLESRLTPVAPPVPENVSKSQERIQRSSLAGSVETQAEKIAFACARVESLLSRLEI